MKYGVLYNKNNINIGDDIQAYATARFLPSIDYFIDREHIDEFETEDKKAVGVIMNAWYMWAKWNWPPSKYIYPHFVGFHYADHQLAKQHSGTPIKFEFLEGVGGEYLKDYEPIGCRDMFTKNRLKDLGIDSYFSGCITLTLPKQPETPDKGKYICLVDVDERASEKIKEQLKDEDIEIKMIKHSRKREPEMSWEDRVKTVEERLTMYQNARCVVTKRLHCALPCLAMEVPVFMIKDMDDDIRFDPYYDFIYRSNVSNFLQGKITYDFMNPPENKPDYKPVREALIKSCEEFVEKTKKTDDDPDKLDKRTYTENELIKWRHDTMKKMMDVWLFDRRDRTVAGKKQKAKMDKLEKSLEINRADKLKFKEKSKIRLERIEELKEKNKKLTEDKKQLKDKNEKIKKENEELKKQLKIEKSRGLWEIIKIKVKRRIGSNNR